MSQSSREPPTYAGVYWRRANVRAQANIGLIRLFANGAIHWCPAGAMRSYELHRMNSAEWYGLLEAPQ